ncbi:GMC oxidoreductase [Gymnopilus junonius]|uniref:pyranose dehydrogenase (acceptor) n=1 Tax=Gymnopilus junonius TaxID=109634 RepID=A0A9P5NBH5_GYMJU|nr:GMC oxidoreductase [Gymnopilus junonius]
MPFVKVDDVSRKSFDYIIMGGGTAGLTAAARLTEDPSVTVLVLEAGPVENLGDSKIDLPAQFGHTLGNPQYDWAFKTVKQKHANDNQFLWGRGKGLGGSSAINFLGWVKPPAADIDAIEKLGNPGWNWADYQKYSQRSETAHLPAQEQKALYPHTYTAEFGGTSGPVQVSIPPHVHTIDKIFQPTMLNVGLKRIDDPYGGDITGTWMTSSTIDPKTWIRSYAASAYLLPNLNRPNLKVLTSVLISRVEFDEINADRKRVATGVDFVHSGVTHSAFINKEVILSTGAIKSPQILELSGIGQPEILSKIGVDLVVDLPGVGENVQEHTIVGIPHELTPGPNHETLDLLRDPGYFSKATELHAAGKGLLRFGVTSAAYFPFSIINWKEFPVLIDNLEAELATQQKSGMLPPGLEEQFRIQISALRDNAIPDCEILCFPGLNSRKVLPEANKSYVTPMVLLNHPFSRGTIHAESSDPAAPPVIDPHYFENKFDLEVLLQQIKFVCSLKDVEPWKSGVLREVTPGPNCMSDDDLRDFIKNNVSSSWHTIGSCSMLPRNKRGVVDPELKVYGTSNLRIADLSVVPLHIAAHTQATAYVIGEKVADIIKATPSYSMNSMCSAES